MAPPVAPKPRLLPFYDPNFSWDTFEGFFCDFVAAAPELIGKDGKPCRVVSSSLYGRRGDSQHGIDIRAEMSNGEVWVFQCKHYKSWGPKETEDAIAKCDYKADRKFLLVTRPVSPESREVIAKHAEWTLWDSEDISREFLLRLPEAEAARVLYRNFGPAWPKELLGLAGSGPLISAEAKFAPLLEAGRSFHHRLDMVGRSEWLKALDNFVGAKDSRVFFIIGRGGLGKSRLLREWSRGFSERHKDWTLQFVSDSAADFATALDASPKPLVLAFDDAHRLDEVRRALFSELPSRKDIKLVLALRPGPVAQVESELIDAGFDVTYIEKPAAMKRLTSEQALQLAEAALGGDFAGRFRLPLRDLSRDCPLLAVLAAELLKRGELVEHDLNDTAEFRNHVFEGLLRDARPVEERFGAAFVGDLLRLLAVLAPVKLDKEFLKRAATVLGDGTESNHVSNILSALDDAGLLLATGAGVRVSPDLLSDHLAYTACYDKHGRDRAFVERVVAQFPPDQFPKLLQHLAEAEWRALRENESADSVVEPLWRSLVSRFEASSFYARAEQLKVWANVAHLQPHRTIELAQLALRLNAAPPETNQWMRSKKWNSHPIVLDGLPSLLKPLAIHHPDFVAPALDILWEIGRDRPAPPFNSQAHAITKIGEIGSFQSGKRLPIQDEVLNWIERLLAGNDWTNRVNKPGWLLTQMLNPFFATGMEEHWQTGNIIHWRTVPLHLDNTAGHRDRVFSVLRAIVSRKSVPLTLATLNVLEHAMRRAYLGASQVPVQFAERWLIERKKALAVLAEIVRDCDSPVVHFHARRILLHNIRYEDAEFRAACRKVYETIPDSLDFQIVRATLGSHWDEFEGSRRTNWQKQAKHRWDHFINSTAEAIVSQWPEQDALLSNLGQRYHELVDLGFRPDYSPLFRSVAAAKPKIARDIATGLIAQPAHPLGHLLDSLVIPITKSAPDLRLQLCEAAFAAGTDELKVGAIHCCASWRQEGLPARARELVAASAVDASPSVASAIIRFIFLNHHNAEPGDWELLAALPADPEDWWVLHGMMERAEDLLEHGTVPTPEIADQILRKLDALPSISGHPIEQAIAQFAKHFPGKVFLMMRRRQQNRDHKDEDFDVVPFDFHTIRFADVLADPDAAQVIHELEDRLINGTEMDYSETEILQIAVMQSAESAEENLFRILGKAKTGEQLERVAQFVVHWLFWPVVLSCPDFARKLLQRAKETDEDIHKKIFRSLQSLPGSRGASADEPNAEWKSLVEAVEKMAEQYQQDSDLGPLYAAAAKNEREWMKSMRRHLPDEDSWEE